MKRFLDEDLRQAEFRECDLTGARLVGVVVQDVVIDGLVSNLVVNGVDVAGFVEVELDRRYPARPLLRSEDAAELRRGALEVHEGWAETVRRLRRSPGLEHESVNGEWSALQTLRHLVFVHDSWFRRCCLGSSAPFTPMGLGIDGIDPQEQGLDPSADPTLPEVLAVRDAQTAELETWLGSASTELLAQPAAIPDNDLWPPYARGRSVRQCLGTVLREEFEHLRFCVRDLDLIEHPTHV
ncbi:DinB family protein [Brachybacterium sp. NPDC056505]|uniref:DinB family protein n=1 Tax=Brachybacterium sp. NPDC056505 TaxID=3345843 RepID=UPI00366DBBC9